MTTPAMGLVLMSAGAVATAAGALLYILPGPGLPLLMAGPVLLGVGAVVRALSRRKSQRVHRSG
ncbi:hypothetical protein DDV98_15955 [Streptomyces sp. IB2014 011-12]|nr:hypothetical protein STIB_25080 [Streptomyces sp. IB2014 011-1]RDV50847.1 hypothetical protein DDV98_15955 [Streptomyces sp. IB2014 011-12]